ncbi:hypothetical protein OHU34_43920 (plasmid) [Streptomyces sp. NBC_00080]|uniref:hypothetical protein n=1 Tax=Streptomyces sp. NBC_00080 TaxID=2975645 RepID=UPI002F910BD0
MADLANANARNIRLAARVGQLEARLSKALGQAAWHASGMAAPTDVTELQERLTYLEQHAVDLARALEERQDELEAARAANRDLTRALNHRG